MGISSFLIRLVMCVIWPSWKYQLKGLSMSAYPMSI
jgi:hypothetical protein